MSGEAARSIGGVDLSGVMGAWQRGSRRWVGYTSSVLSLVALELLRVPGTARTVPGIARAVRFSHSTVRLVVLDLVAVGHLDVEVASVAVNGAACGKRYRLSAKGLHVYRWALRGAL